jgi:WD40 repeat protein
MNGQELSSINELVWSKDGKTLAALTNTGGISLILPEKGEYLKSYLGLNTHLNEYPQGLDYGPGEKEIAFGCENKICILNLDTEKVRTINVEGQTSKTIALFWIKGTNVIGSASKEKVILVDAVSGNVVKTFLSTN